eukprot:TRINITY_DN26820_c0_g1_i1.p1 TRINITY_DN26820_c0_g1~~TRINITY_DN26820_c0_g1_i1.p1  ORF type:complete len:217 (-),score=54.91 TRINITY_DN26820_c0_g1_i1:64-714(-)
MLLLLVDDGIHVGAHRVILAACSSFSGGCSPQTNHSHPWIYLKGITSLELKAVVDFMYQGEVNVPQDNLSQFLATAEELKVKGLSGYGSMSGIGRSDRTFEDQNDFEVAGHKQQHFEVDTAWGDEIEGGLKESILTENNIKSEYDHEFEEEPGEMQDYNTGLVIVEEEPNVINEKIIEVNAELDKQIEEILSRVMELGRAKFVANSQITKVTKAAC